MKTLEYRTVDKSEWGQGGWLDEPDKKQWRDAATGLPCLIVRGVFTGALCGYVGVTRDHPLHGKDYDAADQRVDVHGGLSFASSCSHGDETRSICHVVEPGEPDDDVWWLGFDCGHYMDLSPLLEMRVKSSRFRVNGSVREEIYRDIAWVTAEVEKLARQLKAIT